MSHTYRRGKGIGGESGYCKSDSVPDPFVFSDGEVYLLRHPDLRQRGATVNLRKGLMILLRKAGLTPWPRLFHNLPASRQTELAAQFPAHVCCSWIGNSERIAAAHYLQVTDADFAKATSEGAGDDQKGAVKSGAVAVQNAVQTALDRNCQLSEKSPETPIIGDVRQVLSSLVL